MEGDESLLGYQVTQSILMPVVHVHVYGNCKQSHLLISLWHYLDWPDPETFEENLAVHGIDKTPLKFRLPDVSDVEIAGLEEVKEELVAFPPYMDIKDLLKPM